MKILLSLLMLFALTFTSDVGNASNVNKQNSNIVFQSQLQSVDGFTFTFTSTDVNLFSNSQTNINCISFTPYENYVLDYSYKFLDVVNKRGYDSINRHIKLNAFYNINLTFKKSTLTKNIAHYRIDKILLC